MSRRLVLRLILSTAFAAVSGDVWGAKTADLKDRLEKDLQVRLPADFAFVAKVISMVEADELPLGLVNSCYLWARKQRNYHFQHFRQAVRQRAKLLGIAV